MAGTETELPAAVADEVRVGVVVADRVRRASESGACPARGD